MVAMNLVLLVLGGGGARLLGLTGPDGLAISVELGVQNATLGIAVAGHVAAASGIPEFALPSGLYGITMYMVTIPGMFLLKLLLR